MPGTFFLLVNTLTDTPVGMKEPSFKDHGKIDAAFLAGLGLLTFYKSIRRNRKALSFHLTFLSTAIAHYLLTNYNTRPDENISDVIV